MAIRKRVKKNYLKKKSNDDKGVVTALLDSKKANQLIFMPKIAQKDTIIRYKLSGFLEMSYTMLKGYKTRFQIKVVNIKAELIDCETKNIPKTLHVSLNNPHESPYTVEPQDPEGNFNLDLAITYPELENDKKHLGKPERNHLPPILPITTNALVGFKIDLKKNLFITTGTSIVPEFVPVTYSPTPMFFIYYCVFAKTSYCKTMCIHIKVAPKANNSPIISKTKIKDIIDEVNAIWGCTNGQCCIDIKIKNIVIPLGNGGNTRLKKDVTLTSGSYSNDFKNMSQIERSTDCYNLYIVDDIIGTMKGQTGFGTKAGTFIKTKGRTDAGIGITVAHELGHALGIGSGGGTSSDGVKGHSNKADNVMYNGTGPTSKKLNKDQCEKARSSSHLEVTEVACTSSPNE